MNKEQLLRVLLDDLSIKAYYSKGILEKTKEINKVYIDLRNKVMEGSKKFVDEFLEKHKNVSHSTLLKFLSESKYPEKYEADIKKIVDNTNNIVNSYSFVLSKFSLSEIKRMPIATVDILFMFDLVDTRWITVIPFVKTKTKSIT